MFDYLRKIIIYRQSLSAIKGYCVLRNHDPDFINRVRNDIANQQYIISKNRFERYFFPSNLDLPLSVHQFLLKKLMGRMFTRRLLSYQYNKAIFAYPMPDQWIEVLKENGVRVSRIRCKLLFFLLVAFSWLGGLWSFFKHIKAQANRKIQKDAFSYFFDLDASCLPTQTETNSSSYTLINWYIEKYQADEKVLHSVCELPYDNQIKQVDIEYVVDHYPRLSAFDFYIKYMPQIIVVLTLGALTNLLLFRWWNIILLSEIVHMKLFSFDKSGNRNKYWFHFSDQIYRPLWTYVAEKNGDQLIFYFYSCHISTYKEKKGYSTTPEFWQVMNWPTYFVWNSTHADYIKKEIQFPTDIVVVGPIWYQEGSVYTEAFKRPTIVAFDIQPYREFFSYTFASAQKYTYDYKVPVSFLKDIQEVAEELGYDLAFKRKRNAAMLNKKYLNFIKSLKGKENTLEVDPDVSAFRIAKMADVVVSMPYTSTAVVAKECGKESIFYDPFNTLLDDDRASHGIKLLKGKEELKGFIESLGRAESVVV